MNRTGWKKRLIFILAGIAVTVILAAAGLRLFNPPYVPTPRALELTGVVDGVRVKTESFGLVYLPQEEMLDTGLIFYPGGNVDYRAYSYWGAGLAAQGHPVVIVRMPFHLAVLAPNRAARAKDALPDVSRWVLAGHSLGGAMAGRYVLREDAGMDALVLLGSYVDRDLRETGLPVLSLLGSEDGIINRENLEKGRRRLPRDTRWAVLEGGNHGFFGDYGLQKGDAEGQVTFEMQRDWALTEVAQFLRALDGGQ